MSILWNQERYQKLLLKDFKLFNLASHQLKFISEIGENIIVVFLCILFTVILLIIKRYYSSALVAALTSASYLYSVYLKGLFKLQRPEYALTTYHSLFNKYGFPSSHVIFYTSFWGFLFYLTFKYEKRAKLFLHCLRWVSVYMMVSVGSSRIFLGMHYLKDVVGGYFFGFLFLLILIYLDKKLDKVFTKY